MKAAMATTTTAVMADLRIDPKSSDLLGLTGVEPILTIPGAKNGLIRLETDASKLTKE